MLRFLHTAQVHVDTFNTLRDRIAPGAALSHAVHPELLEQAQGGITPALETRIADLIAGKGTIICTCTTIGEVAADYGAIRIDQPMMRAAAGLGRVLMVYALASTRAASRDLFLAQGGRGDQVQMLDLTAHWSLFADGDVTGFHRAIADAVRAAPFKYDAVVLAQASMAGAADMLTDLPVSVLTSPEMALRAGLGL